MTKENIVLALKTVIWVCLGVIFFSSLYVNSHLFFPFIVSKTVAFDVAVELMFVAFLLLAWRDNSYKLRINWAIILAALYLVILTIASIFGDNFYHSFWSNNERSDGILLLIHLFLFIWVLTSFLRTTKEWMYAFDLFLASSVCVSLVALDQFLNIKFGLPNHFLASSNGERLASTIGNSGYVGGYAIFGIFVSLFLLFKWKKSTFGNYYWGIMALEGVLLLAVAAINGASSFAVMALLLPGVCILLWQFGAYRIYYVLAFVLETFIAIQTYTRGAYMALGFGLGFFILYLFWFYFNKKYLKIIAIFLILFGILCIGLIFVYSSSPIITSNPVLSRIASISDTGGTANNRLVTWGIAWQGIKQRPLLGYGQENFYVVFDKYYSTKNTEQWFDRSHDMIFDRAITGGFLGLLSYLCLLLIPFYFLWYFYFKEYKNEKESTISSGRRFLTPVIFTILILSYIIQNLFIFEALVTYIPLMTIIAFAGLYSPHFDFKILSSQKLKQVAAVVFVIILIPSIYYFNVIPVRANMDLIKILSSQTMPLNQRIDAFEELLSGDTLGNTEYRRQYFNFFENVMTTWLKDEKFRSQFPDTQMSAFADKAESQLLIQIQNNPHSIIDRIMLMRFYNLAYVFKVERLDKAMEQFKLAKELSAGRPQVYYEAATAYFYRANYLAFNKKDQEAENDLAAAIDLFYEGASLNYHKKDAFDQFSSFLGTAKTSPQFVNVLVKRGAVGKKISEVTAEMFNWLSSEPAEKKDVSMATMKDLLNILLIADPKNDELKKQLEGLK